MAYREVYRRQVQLLVRTLPVIAAEPVFALKGGTAINLFVRDMPRLSVDIDLTYLPNDTFDAAVAGINMAFERIIAGIKVAIPGSQTHVHRTPAGLIERVHLQAANAGIKIEVTPVLRGVVYDPAMTAVAPKVEAQFGFAETTMVSFADLYAGKLIAALDRQHPRDLFDVRLLLANEGVDDNLRIAFVAYLLSSAKPLHAILAPKRRDLQAKYDQEFVGMTDEEVPLAELLATRDAMIATLVGEMPDHHRRFLLGFKRGQPEWDLLPIPHVRDLPAIRLRIEKLDALNPAARAEQIGRFEAVLAATA